MTDDDPDNTPRTYIEGEQHHTGPYRGLDPMQAELLRRLDRLDRVEHTVELMDRAWAVLTASRRFWGWAAGIGVPALIAGAFALLAASHNEASASAERVGRTEARIEGQAELIKLLQQEVIELRRRAGLDHPNPNSIDLMSPDKYSLVDQGGSGGSSPHLEKLHRLHPRCGKTWHSGLLLQMSPQTSGRRMSSMSLARSIDSLSMTLGGGGALGSVSTGDAQPAATTAMTRMCLSIPRM